MTIVAKAGTIPRRYLRHDGRGNTGPDGPAIKVNVTCGTCLTTGLAVFTYTVFKTWTCPLCAGLNAWWPIFGGSEFFIGFYNDAEPE